MPHKLTGFFDEDQIRSDDPKAAEVAEREQRYRERRAEERTRPAMVTRQGLLYPETKSVLEWRKFDGRRRQEG